MVWLRLADHSEENERVGALKIGKRAQPAVQQQQQIQPENGDPTPGGLQSSPTDLGAQAVSLLPIPEYDFSTESDVEQKFIMPLLTHPSFLEIPSRAILTKRTVFCAARGQATCQFRRRPRSSWSSISRPPRHSVSMCLGFSSSVPTR